MPNAAPPLACYKIECLAGLIESGRGSRLQRGGSLRVGTAYRTQADGDVCTPCTDAGAGGDGQGNYFEPDEPPLPGEDCLGRGNCRCWLQTIYEVDEAA